MCRSEPQMPLASTRTSASSGALRAGSGTSATATSPGAWKVTACMASGGLRVVVVVVVGEEALAGRPPDAAGQHEPAQQRRGAVALLAVLVPQRVQDAQHVVEPDLVAPREWPARVVQAVDHAGVEVGRRADALA